ncbi:MAG: M10 family metallopeptidase C-terminal domain-containing protein [Cypionkella sp.]|nr:M10 family metallopeptidase C-terminal domain-containing protein [Cypionkella sp.]
MTTSASTTDIIYDFKRGSDKIDLSTIDASTKIGNNGKFTFDGKTAHSTST